MRTNDSPSETETLHTMSETKSPASAALGVDAPRHEPAYVLAFDTANEVIAVGVGVLHEEAHAIELVAHTEIEARRQSNTQLSPRIDALLAERGIARGDIACVCVGRGPGSFTGVRIAMATAKGIASALEVGLVGVSSLDAVAWGVWEFGTRGEVAVVADAMRKEVYPVRYLVDDAGAHRLEADRVVKADLAAEELVECDMATPDASGSCGTRFVKGVESGDDELLSYADAPEAGGYAPRAVPQRSEDCLSTEYTSQPLRAAGSCGRQLLLAGDALKKYRDLFAPCGEALPESTWTPTGAGLLLALLARLVRARAAIAAALGAMAALRCGLRALDGKRDLAVRCNGKHLDLHSLPIAQHSRKILHELIRNLRNMNKTRLALGQRNKCAERLDTGDLPLDNIPNL